MWNPTQLALLREAGIAGNSLSAGLAALRKANYAQVGIYSQAFFNLSTGFERFFKLLYILDRLIESRSFPTDKDLRKAGHDIEKLFDYTRQIKIKYQIQTDPNQISDSSIEMKIVMFLSKFAKSTRYFNLDFLAGGISDVSVVDPIADWFGNVGQAILEKHYTPRQQSRVKRNAEIIDKMMRQYAVVDHTAEDGTPLTDVYSASYQSGMTEIIRKYGTLYCARLCRFSYYILIDLRDRCHSNDIGVPYLDELFFPFMNDDSYLLSRKTFPPRGQGE